MCRKGENEVTKPVKSYVTAMDTVSRTFGKFVMFLIMPMMGVLLFEAISRTIFNKPHIWAVEFSQFMMASYYLLGGCYSHLIDGHVRMDIFYERWTWRRRATFDVFTFVLLGFYLTILLIGAIQGVGYAVEFKQVSYTAWAPRLAPIKIIMTVGIVLMILQVVSEFFKDVARARGEEIPREQGVIK
jgi:TRAP-type mannitol/chloroaromatic compound transport system permease small subunit